MKICLFVCVPQYSENNPKSGSFFYELKQFIKRCIDLSFWLFRNNRFYFHAWEKRHNTNKGDIVVREKIRAQLASVFSDTNVSFTEIGWLDLNEHTAIEIGNTHDLFVIAGSGYLRFDDANELPQRLKLDAENFKKIKCKKIAYGIGVNKKNTHAGEFRQDYLGSFPKVTLDALKRIFADCKVVSVRDELTRAIVSTVSPVPVHLMGDPALFIDEVHSNRSRPKSSTLRLGFNIALHEGEVISRLKNTLPIYVDFFRRMQKEKGAEIHYIQHNDIERIIPIMLSLHGLHVKSHANDASKLTDIYETLDLHICEMLHSSILSLSAGVPTINIPYDFKNRSFFELMNMEEFVVSPKQLSADRLWDLALSALNQGETLSRRIQARICELRGERDEVLRLVREITNINT